MREWQLLIIWELPSIGDGLNSLEVEEPIVSEQKSLPFLAEDGIGVGYSMDDLRVGLLLDVLEKLRAGELLFVRVGLLELAVGDSGVHVRILFLFGFNYKITLHTRKEIDFGLNKRVDLCINNRGFKIFMGYLLLFLWIVKQKSDDFIDVKIFHQQVQDAMMDKQITQIAIYRSKVTYLQRFGLDLQHAAVHIFVDGNTEVWEYGTYNGTNGILVLRDEGKTNDESLLISCQLQTPLAYSRFVDFSKACCQGKTWGFRLTQTQTSCEFYVLQVLRQFTNSKCVALMTQKIEQNWRRAVQQSVRNQAAKSGSFENAKSVTEAYIDILLPRPY